MNRIPTWKKTLTAVTLTALVGTHAPAATAQETAPVATQCNTATEQCAGETTAKEESSDEQSSEAGNVIGIVAIFILAGVAFLISVRNTGPME